MPESHNINVDADTFYELAEQILKSVIQSPGGLRMTSAETFAYANVLLQLEQTKSLQSIAESLKALAERSS